MLGLFSTLAQYFIMILDDGKYPKTLWYILYNLVLYAVLSIEDQYLVLKDSAQYLRCNT